MKEARKFVLKENLSVPNAKKEIHSDRIIYRYEGDFFMIEAAVFTEARERHHSVSLLNHSPKYARLFYSDAQVEFVVDIEKEAIADYELLNVFGESNRTFGYCPIQLEAAVFNFFHDSLHGPLADQYLYARVVDLLIAISEILVQQNHTFSATELELVENARTLIEADLSVQLGVKQICKSLRVSPKALQALFRQQMGMTIGEFARNRRMNLAKQLLETTDEILLSIALAVGYNDPGNFSVAFKKYFGYSPGRVREKNISSGNSTEH